MGKFRKTKGFWTTIQRCLECKNASKNDRKVCWKCGSMNLEVVVGRPINTYEAQPFYTKNYPDELIKVCIEYKDMPNSYVDFN